MTTIVAKLFNAVQPQKAYFGQKDAQQALILERMCADLLVPVRVRRGATVRERDGLAMSSRNRYLDADERAQAVALVLGLRAARSRLVAGERSAARLAAAIRTVWRAYPRVREDRIDIVDARDLTPVRTVRGPILIAVAARVGAARLIDNLTWRP